MLIVDWDVHHGNGTQDVFYSDEQVSFFSMHRWPFYPGTGDKDETGSGRGLGFTKNVPVAFGTPREKILANFQKDLEAFADKTKPQLVIISAGFDAHIRDPIGSLELETEDFRTLTKIVQGVADAHAQGRIVSALEYMSPFGISTSSPSSFLSDVARTPIYSTFPCSLPTKR